MLKVGVIDRDETVVEAMLELWRDRFSLRRVDSDHDDLDDIDVLVADPASLEGRALSVLHELRAGYPSLKLVLTFVYCDRTQSIEDEIHALADACVLKPYDFEKLAHTVLAVCGEGAQEEPRNGSTS